jgi:hypothetical protein
VKLPDSSRFCREGKHEDCAHWYGMGSDYVHLCQCGCHDACPVRGARALTRVLKKDCTCPGGSAWRALEDEMRPRLDEQRRVDEVRSSKAQAAMRSVKARPGSSEAEIREELSRAYEEHGIEPIPGELELAAAAIRSWGPPKSRSAAGVFDRFVDHLSRALKGNADDPTAGDEDALADPSREERPPL